jgi:hypothetical protein
MTPEPTLRRAASTAGYLLAGAVGTALLSLALLRALTPLQAVVYDALSLAVGPWTATESATVLTFTLAALCAAAVTALLVAYTDRGVASVRPLASALGVALLAVGLFTVASAFLGVAGLLAAAVAFAGFALGVPVAVRALAGWSDGLTALVGAVPTLLVLLFLLGFGLGWGGGYDLVATEVPDSAVDGQPAAEFAEVPALRADLLAPTEGSAGYCERDESGRWTCHLPLRGYDGEARAARFLDRHGARCPFLNAPTRDPSGGTFLAVDGETYYRVSCVAYGD